MTGVSTDHRPRSVDIAKVSRGARRREAASKRNTCGTKGCEELAARMGGHGSGLLNETRKFGGYTRAGLRLFGDWLEGTEICVEDLPVANDVPFRQHGKRHLLTSSPV